MTRLPTTIDLMRNDLVDKCLFVISLFFIPVTILIGIRVQLLGATHFIYSNPIIMFCCACFYLNRHRIPLRFKSLMLLLSFYLMGTFTYAAMGLMSTALIMFLTLLSWSVVLMDVKQTLILFLVSLVTLIALSSGHLADIGVLAARSQDWIQSPISWILQLTSFSIFSILIFVVIDYQQKTYRNITREAVDARQNYEGLMEGLEDVMYSSDAQGRFVLVNKAFEELTGLKRQQLIGKSFDTIFSGGNLTGLYQDFWQERYHELIAKQEPLAFQTEVSTKQGTYYHDIRLIPILDGEGNIYQIIGAHRDITELIATKNEIGEMLRNENARLEALVSERTQALEASIAELMKKERMASLGTLVTGVAHEINTPVGVSLTAATFLQEQTRQLNTLVLQGDCTKDSYIILREAIEEAECLILRNLEKADIVIQNFLRVAVSQSVPVLEAFDLTEYVQAIAMTLLPEAQQKNIQIKIEYHEPLRIVGYASAFTQILTHLIQNALMHGFNNRSEGTIWIEHTLLEDTLSIVFRDNGVGIPEDQIKAIFNPFFTTNRKEGASGLGLSIIYNLVTDLLDGSITCESVLGQYTTFKIVVPNIMRHAAMN